MDSLFYVDNSNAGSIGFLTSGGQDLGNRFATGSLGYSVGYKNSAGTDLGYLRGQPPLGGTATFTKNNATYCTVTSSRTDSEGNPVYTTTYYVGAVCTVGVNISVPVSSCKVTLVCEGYMGWSGSYAGYFVAPGSTLYCGSTMPSTNTYFGGTRTYLSDYAISGTSLTFSFASYTGRFYHTYTNWTATFELSNSSGSATYTANLNLQYDNGDFSD